MPAKKGIISVIYNGFIACDSEMTLLGRLTNKIEGQITFLGREFPIK